MKNNKLLQKILCFITVFAVILSTFVFYCSADCVYKENVGGYNVGVPFDLVFLGDYQGNGTTKISDFGGIVLDPDINPTDKSNGEKYFNYSNSIPNDTSNTLQDNLTLSFGKFKYNFVTTSLILHQATTNWLDGVDYSISVRPMGSGEVWTSELYTFGQEYASYLSNTINGSTIDSARNSFCSLPSLVYDGVISSLFFTSVDNYALGGYEQLPDYFCVTPYLDYDQLYYDEAAFFSEYDLSLSVSFDVYLNGSSSDDPLRYTFSDIITYSYDGSNRYLESYQSLIDEYYSNSYNNKVQNYVNKIAFRDFKLPLAPIYNSIRNVFSYDDGYICNLKISLLPTDPNVSGYNEFLANFYTSRGYYPIRACGLEYSDISIPQLDISGDEIAYAYVNSTDLFIYDLGTPIYSPVSLSDFNLTSWLGNTIGGVLDVPVISDNITLGTILYVVIGLGFLALVLKFFAGG